MISVIERAKQWLNNRSGAYKRVFDKEDMDVQTVLADLAKFCRADRSTFHTDPRLHAVMEGRREVFLRITHHLNLSTDELWHLYTNAPKE